MNNLRTILTSSLIIATCLIASCDGDDPQTSQDVQALLTGGTWKMNAVTVDGVNKNDLFTNFSLNFTASGFTSSNGEPVWPASGTWTLASDQRSLTRNDGVEVTIDEISDSEMTLKLHWDKTTLGGGRVGSTEGNHTFVLTH